MNEPGRPGLRLRLDLRTLSFWALTALAIAGSMVLSTVVRYWVLSAPYPPGLDGAQWISYGRALAGGTGRSAESTYAPLVPILAYRLDQILGPTQGLRVLSTLVLVLLATTIWWLGVRALGVTWGSLMTALILPCTAMAEPFYYGGYAQQASLAFGILGMVALLNARSVDSEDAQKLAFVLASGAFLLASASHLLFGPLFLASASLLSIVTGMSRPDRRRFLRRTAISLSPAIVVSALVARAYVAHEYAAPLAISQRTLREAWVYATREAPWLWAAIVLGGIALSSMLVLGGISRTSNNSTLRLPNAIIMGFAMATPGGVLMLVSGQPRLAPTLLLGGAMLFAYSSRQTMRRWDKIGPVILTAWVIAIFWLAGATTSLVREFAIYYQVLDASLISATRSIPETNRGSIAVAADRRGWPVGWWVEALQERPVFTGSNPQWLAFPAERSRAASTSALFASRGAQDLRRQAAEMGVAYLVIRKWDWIGWERWTDSATHAVTIIYDDDETLVMKIAPVSP